MSLRLGIIALFALAAKSVLSANEDDLVKNLPGLVFSTNFNTYSGYLNANANATWKMHYWLTESRSNPSSDPLLVWFNGGPGCSSFSGSFEELGPFYVNKDSRSLYENVYSWNQKANVLFLESPIGVGFSYNTENYNFTSANDDQTADQNYMALKDFFSRVQTKYAKRSFFISGESYAGIYLPMLAQRLVKGINSGDFPNNNFQGVAIGNGYMNEKLLMNSLIVWSNYHARVSLDQWERIKKVCCNNGDVDNCNFYEHMITTTNLDFHSDGSECGNLTVPLLTLPSFMDQYNYYQDCYNGNSITYYSKKALMNYAKASPSIAIYHNTADLLNYDSTDNQYGYPCWQEDSVKAYLNRPDVQDAIHIAPEWRKANVSWVDCNNAIYNQYAVTYTDTTQFFKYVIDNVKTVNFRFLIYNGDVDTVCNFLGDAWHIRDVAASLNYSSTARAPWLFRDQHAGFMQRYFSTSSNVSMDVLTVKGAGHFVPNDRPGPSMQMITNFMWPTPSSGAVDYSSTTNVNVTPKPGALLPGSNQMPPSSTTTSSATQPQTFISSLILCVLVLVAIAQ